MNAPKKQYPWRLKLKLLDLFGLEIKVGGGHCPSATPLPPLATPLRTYVK